MKALTLTVHGDEKLREGLRDALKKFPERLLRLGWGVAHHYERFLKTAYSAGPLFSMGSSAGLAGSVTAFSELRGGRLLAGAGTKKFYAIVHEEGRVIVPVNKKALAFVTRSGEKVITRRVVIPARKPGEVAARRSEPTIRAFIERNAAQLFGGK
jgi:hypothetical protein